VGFDLGSEATRRAAIEEAVSSGRTTATGRLRLVQTRDQYGFQRIGPVFTPGDEPRSPAERAERLTGLVVGVIRISDVVEGAMGFLRPLDAEVGIFDDSAAPEQALLFSRRLRGSDALAAEPPGGISHVAQLHVGGRPWTVRASMDAAALAARETQNPMGLLLAGLLTTSLLAAGLLLNARKAAAIQASSEQLRRALADRAEADEALRLSELRYRDVIEEQTELIVRWGPDTRLSFASPSLARFLARPREALEGRLLSEALGEKTADALTAGSSQLSPELPVSNVELQLEDPFGRRFWYAWTRRAHFDEARSLTHFQAVGRDITLRKRAQETLREQEERFRRLADASFEGIALTYQGRMVDANPQLATMLGYEVAHLLGREVTQFVAPESLAEVEKRIRSNDEGPYEHLALRRDGKRIPVEVRARSIQIAGRPMRISAVRDVTEQKRGQEELARSRAFLDTIFAGIDLAVWVIEVELDGSLRPVACNPAWLELLGVGVREIDAVCGRDIEGLAAILPASQVAGERAAIERCIAAGTPLREAATDGFLSGSGRDFLRQLNPLRDSDGRIFRVIGTLVEITELTRAERTLREGQRLLAEAQRIGKLGGWEADLPTGPLRVSQQVWSLAGEPENLPPPDAWTWETVRRLVHHADAPRLVAALRSLGAGDRLSDLELRFVRPDGSVVVGLVQAETERAADGVPVRIRGTVQDITERKQVEEAAERQRQELLKADKMIALGTLLAGVAHEINNPNHFILQSLPLLRAAWKDALPVLDAHAERDPDFSLANLPYHEMRTEMPTLVEEVAQGAERIKFIVSELRAYTREQTHTTTSVSLNEAVRSSLTLLANPIRKATRRFSVDYQEDLPSVRGNLRRLEQIVINLILNACQSLPDADRAVRVKTRHDVEAGRVALTVSDEGVGIAPAVLQRITDPFFTTKRDVGGTGLGLAVAARIVEEHGGRLSFESEVGRGTVATLSLPVGAEDA